MSMGRAAEASVLNLIKPMVVTAEKRPHTDIRNPEQTEDRLGNPVFGIIIRCDSIVANSILLGRALLTELLLAHLPGRCVPVLPAAR